MGQTLEFRNGAQVKADGSPSESAATKLIALAESQPDLFHDVMGDGYATVMIGGHHETMLIRSGAFKRFLSWQFYSSEGKAAQPQAVTAAIHTIEAMAVHERSQKQVHARIAQQDGAIYLNLANDARGIVRITDQGWSIVANTEVPGVKFHSYKGVLALPRPVPDGALNGFRSLVNVVDDDWPLVIGFELGCFRELGPFPILDLLGESAAGKTTITHLLKSVIDPSQPAARSLPKDERDLMIQAENAHLLAFDNISHIDEAMSDSLCRLATGGGLSTRSLYSDRDQTIFHGARPLVLNSIAEVVSRGDLMSRSIRVEVPALTERKQERTFWAEFAGAHAAVLGVLCTAASVALQDTPENDWAPDVRMVDFALFVERGEIMLGLEPEAFVRAYQSNQEAANDSVVEQSALAVALMTFASHQSDEWNGTVTDLLNALGGYASEQTKKSIEWPKTAKALGNKLRNIIPNLRRAGIAVKFSGKDPSTRRYLVSISKA